MSSTAQPYNRRVHRFCAPALNPGDEFVALPREEAEHLTRVLRLGPDADVSVFDGRGREFLARVVSANRSDARVKILAETTPTAPEPAVALTLAQAVVKGNKMDDIVRDAAMLGVAAIHPIVTARSELTVASLQRAGKIERWRRIALNSVKQCGRAVVPEIRQPLTLESFVDEPGPALRLMLVEPRAGSDATSVGLLKARATPLEAVVIVGPEGGWSVGELALAHQRAITMVTLGRRTLRADAVPIAAIAVLQFLWGDL